MVGEERVQLQALSEILDGFHASQVLEEIEVSVNVDASADKSVPVDTLQLEIGVILLEFEIKSFVEVNVRPLDRVHVIVGRHKLICVEVLGEDFH